MQKSNTLKMLLKQLNGEESKHENEVFLKWLNQTSENEVFFNKLKTIVDENNCHEESIQFTTRPTFLGRFSRKKIQEFIINKAIGNLIGFIIGMWVTAMFSDYVLERRGLRNLFGLTGQKKVVVNVIPEWLQSGIAILIGFIALELINHFFQSNQHLIVWNYLKKSYSKSRDAITTNKN